MPPGNFLTFNAELGGTPLDHAIGIDPVHGLAIHRARATNGRAEVTASPL